MWLLGDHGRQIKWHSIVNYLTIAEFEVNGIEGFFEPSDNWEELSSSEVRDIEKKFD